MKILIEGEKIISAGSLSYTPKEGQEAIEIADSDWKGYIKSDIRYIDGQIVEVSQDEILSTKKTEKINAIDEKTKSLINSCSFEYDTKTFSGSYSAKNIWTDYLLGVENSVIPLPLEKATIENKSYSITAMEQIKEALQSMFIVHYTIAQPTIQLKNEINNCLTMDELDLIEDNR